MAGLGYSGYTGLAAFLQTITQNLANKKAQEREDVMLQKKYDLENRQKANEEIAKGLREGTLGADVVNPELTGVATSLYAPKGTVVAGRQVGAVGTEAPEQADIGSVIADLYSGKNSGKYTISQKMKPKTESDVLLDEARMNLVKQQAEFAQRRNTIAAKVASGKPLTRDELAIINSSRPLSLGEQIGSLEGGVGGTPRTIRVKIKGTNNTGTIPENEFDPNVYERI